MRNRLFAALPALLEETPDGLGYDPIFDEVATRVDSRSLYYGCLKALQATHDARRELGTIAPPPSTVEGRDPEWPAFRFRLETPWGTVRFDNRYENDRHERNPLLVVDFYGQGVSVLEWAEKGLSLLPTEHLLIEMSYISDSKRRLKLKASGKRYRELIAELK